MLRVFALTTEQMDARTWQLNGKIECADWPDEAAFILGGFTSNLIAYTVVELWSGKHVCSAQRFVGVVDAQSR